MATGVDLSLSGLASGFDWKSFVAQVIQAERAPESTMRTTQAKIQQRNSAFSTIKSQLSTLQTAVQALQDPTLYDSRTVQGSNATVASASATTSATLGVFNFDITQLATNAKLTGTNKVSSPLSSTRDVSTLTLASANFPTPVTAGTFTVNGHQITLATTDTLQAVFDKIAAATSHSVTAAYDSTADKITLSSTSEIVLGSATDTSNFLQAARLNNNGTGSVSSSLPLGSLRFGVPLNQAGFATAVSDGGSGAGEFKINGVSIQFNAGTDSMDALLARINSSGAGVSASYDKFNNRVVLTNQATGDLGIALQDVTGNFLAASGLSAGTLTHGKNLIYSVNGSDPLTSQSNTITESSSGIAGLSVTALKENAAVTVTVASDTDKVKSAIQGFVDAYNKVQSFIGTQTASSTDAQGKVTAGLLANDGAADDIASSLRTAVFSSVSGLSGALGHLADLGYQTNGYDNQIALSHPDQLDSALADNLPGIKTFLSDATNGLATRLNQVLTNTIGDDGTLVTHQKSLNQQSSGIDDQIARMEKTIQADQTRLTNEFIAMESAQAKINQQMQYLSQNFK